MLGWSLTLSVSTYGLFAPFALGWRPIEANSFPEHAFEPSGAFLSGTDSRS